MGNGLVVPCAKLVALEDTHRLASANEKVTFVSKTKSRGGRSSQVCMLPTPDVRIRRDCLLYACDGLCAFPCTRNQLRADWRPRRYQAFRSDAYHATGMPSVPCHTYLRPQSAHGADCGRAVLKQLGIRLGAEPFAAGSIGEYGGKQGSQEGAVACRATRRSNLVP